MGRRGPQNLTSQEFYEDAAVPRAIEFRQKDPLPGPQQETPLLKRNGDGISAEAGFDVGRRIAFNVPISLLPGNKPFEGAQNIRGNGGIPPLIEGQAGRSMGNKDMAKPTRDAALCDGFLDMIGDVYPFGMCSSIDFNFNKHCEPLFDTNG